MFGMYSLVIWFGGLELVSCRADFQDFLVAFLAVLMAAMGLSQSTVSGNFRLHVKWQGGVVCPCVHAGCSALELCFNPAGFCSLDSMPSGLLMLCLPDTFFAIPVVLP